MATNPLQMRIRFLLACLTVSGLFSAALGAEADSEPLPELAIARVGTARYRLPQQAMSAPFADGRRVVAIDGNHLWVLDLATGKPVRSFAWIPPADPARGLVVTADGRAVYCDQRGAMQVLDPNTGKVVHTCKEVWSSVSNRSQISPSGDGRRVVVASGVSWADNKKAGQVLIYDPAEGKVIADVRLDGFDVRGAALSADGKRFAVLGVGAEPKPGADKKKPRALDLMEIREVASGATVSRLRGALESWVNNVPACFSPDGKLFAAVMWPGVQVWDVATGRSLWRDEADASATELRFTPDGRHLCAATSWFGEGRVWDAATGKAKAKYPFPKRGAEPRIVPGFRGETPSEMRMVFTADGRWLAVGWCGLALCSWDVKASKLLTRIDGFTWPVTAVRFSPDGQQLIAATDALAVARADARTGRITVAVRLRLAEDQLPDPVLWFGRPAVALSPDGRYLAYGTRSGKIAVAELATSRVPWTAPLNKAKGYHIAPVFSPDGSKLVMSEWFNQEADERAYPPMHVWDAASGKPIPAVKLRSGYKTSVAFSPDGRRAAAVAFLGSADGDCLSTWDLSAGRPLVSQRGAFGKWLAIAPGQRTLLTTEENCLVGRDLITGQVTRRLELLPPEDPGMREFRRRDRRLPRFALDRAGPLLTCSFAFSPDGRLFAVGAVIPATGEAVVRVYEWAGFGERFVLRGHAGPVRCLAFSPDGKLLASASQDNTVLVWNVSRAWKTSPGKGLATADALWRKLSAPAAGPAWDAVRELVSRPDVAVALLRQRLKPIASPGVTAVDIPNLIQQLDARTFTERDRASRALQRLGQKAIPQLQRAAENGPTLEVRRRAAELVKAVSLPDPDFPVQSRAVEVLEQIGSAAAKDVLRTWARGWAPAPLTQEAQAAVARLEAGGR